ncbi:MAG: cell division protein FtsQ [Flammeovirgaceae bacterium]|nr:MAG: cell division protein FtsQ [Flammeovirgaceae bacterium]
MKGKWKIRKELKIGVALAVLFFFVAFTERKLGSQSVNDVIVKVENVDDNHFIDEEDILKLIRLDRENLKGADLARLNLKEIESRIKSDRFIQDADLYSDIKGNLIVRATLRRPIARIIRNDGPDAYVAEDGTIMPVSSKFTARVMLISGDQVRKLLERENITTDESGRHLITLLHMIGNDDFWRAQIAQLHITAKDKIIMLPQIGAQTIEFGTADKAEEKLKKLKIFYKEILPQMGWNRYKRVNVEYDKQLIAE